MSEEEQLLRIYRFLGLDTVDRRLKLKAEIMKKTLQLTFGWKKGVKHKWISKIANRTGVSTRKIRENYIEPLIDEGILREIGDGYIEFAGLPPNAEMPSELMAEQLVEELNEENANRTALGKKPFTMKQWKELRKPRTKVE